MIPGPAGGRGTRLKLEAAWWLLGALDVTAADRGRTGYCRRPVVARRQALRRRNGVSSIPGPAAIAVHRLGGRSQEAAPRRVSVTGPAAVQNRPDRFMPKPSSHDGVDKGRILATDELIVRHRGRDEAHAVPVGHWNTTRALAFDEAGAAVRRIHHFVAQVEPAILRVVQIDGQDQRSKGEGSEKLSVDA